MSDNLTQQIEALRAAHPEAGKTTSLLLSLAAAAQAQAPAWIPVGTELPDADTIVLIAIDDPVCEPVWIGYLDGQVWRDFQDVEVRVTHWRHLPEPPAR